MICYLRASYISKIMPIILLVLAKKKTKSEIMLLLFTLNLVKTPHCLIYKWMANSFTLFTPRNFIVLNSLSDKYKNSTNKQPTRGRHPRACYVHTLSLVERVLSHFLLDPGAMNLTIGRQKNYFDYLNLPVTLILGQNNQ